MTTTPAVIEFALTWSSLCLDTTGEAVLVPADLCIQGGGYVSDPGLDTAVFLSLFLDRRADENTDELPDGDSTFGVANYRGWWGNELLAELGDEYGSRLWLYTRSKLTQSTLENIQRAVEESLAWLVDSQIAESVEVSVAVTVKGRADISIVIQRNKNVPVKYSFVWDSMEGLSFG